MKQFFEIVPYRPEYLDDFAACLTPGDFDADAAEMKKRWVSSRTPENFGARFARLNDGDLCGMVQYIPIEESGAEGQNIWFVYCIWIPPARRNSGGRQRRKGIGRVLLEAAEEDVRSRGAGGLAVWGTPLPFFMQSSFFKRLGYTRTDKTGMQELLWKPFKDTTVPPKWRKPAPFTPGNSDSVTVTAFRCGICPAMNTVHLNFKKAAERLQNRVDYREIDTSSRGAVEKWNRSDSVFIDNREFPMGPPPSYKKIFRILKRTAKRKQR